MYQVTVFVYQSKSFSLQYIYNENKQNDSPFKKKTSDYIDNSKIMYFHQNSSFFYCNCSTIEIWRRFRMLNMVKNAH